MEKRNSRSNKKNMTSHSEPYYLAIHNQELPTKYLINKHDSDDGKQSVTTNADSVRLRCKYN